MTVRAFVRKLESVKTMSKDKQVQSLSIQECYPARFQHCWGCGPKNPAGLHLKSFPSLDGQTCICSIRPDLVFTGGVPDKLFGGIIATVFDCHGTASAAYFARCKAGLTLSLDQPIERFITAHLSVDYLRPVPMGQTLTVTANLEECHEAKVMLRMTLELENQTCARAKMVAVKAKDNM